MFFLFSSLVRSILNSLVFLNTALSNFLLFASFLHRKRNLCKNASRTYRDRNSLLAMILILFQLFPPAICFFSHVIDSRLTGAYNLCQSRRSHRYAIYLLVTVTFSELWHYCWDKHYYFNCLLFLLVPSYHSSYHVRKNFFGNFEIRILKSWSKSCPSLLLL